jgi:hypothetical protein
VRGLYKTYKESSMKDSEVTDVLETFTDEVEKARNLISEVLDINDIGIIAGSLALSTLAYQASTMLDEEDSLLVSKLVKVCSETIDEINSSEVYRELH